MNVRWLALLTNAIESAASNPRFVACGPSRRLYVHDEIKSSSAEAVENARCTVIFDGALYNRDDLKSELGAFPAPIGSDAEVIATGYQRWGEGMLNRLRGSFALVIWDTEREVLLCLRDPLGTFPMFYADSKYGLMVSTSIDTLTRQRGVSSPLNRAALADYFLGRFPRLEETFFEGVNRVPPGHVLHVSVNGRGTYRYWDPAPEGNVNWLSAKDLDQFDDFLDRAVKRCLTLGPAGIFLSGGLDSVSVAAVAAEQCQAESLPNPVALSLVFPDPEMSEEVVQRSVAAQLRLPMVVRPFYEAVGAKQLLRPALEMSRSLSAPLMNTWLPAYSGLALEGKRRGCSTILTGNGGDEWLTITPYLSADLLRDRNFSDLYRLWASLRRSNNRSGLTLMRSLLWRFGAQPLMLPPLHRFVEKKAPVAIRVKRRMFSDFPAWLAPDPALRRELKQRREEYAAKKQKNRCRSFYVEQMRQGLYHPLISWELEEYFEIYQNIGLRILHPYWDADLVDLLYRTPPLMLDHGGRNKGLVRASLGRRFPQLGFERQVKMEATRFYASTVRQEAGAIWQELGGARTLAEMGIIDKKVLSSLFERLQTRRQEGLNAHRVWSVLNLEGWARAQAS
ncbi:MAG TPA: asparagine synthase-related protein [Pyrinomonadaceae bacterium]|nr:asparagine synthase-related protein [Pyrinomonadaceae bacterium]